MSYTLDNLKRQRNWVLWSDRIKGHEGQKIPLEPNGKWARANDPSTWHSYEECSEAVKDSTKDFSGIGFQLIPGVCGIDLDCKDFSGVRPFDVTSFPEHHQEIIRQQDSYTEFSPSGLGAHILTTRPVDADLLTIKNHESGVEVYTIDRYLTLTERRVPGTREDFSNYNAALFSKYKRGKEAPTKKEVGSGTLVSVPASKFTDIKNYAGRNDQLTSIAGLLHNALNFDPEDLVPVLEIFTNRYHATNPKGPMPDKDLRTIARSIGGRKDSEYGDLSRALNYPTPGDHLRSIADFLRSTLGLTDGELLASLKIAAGKFYPKVSVTDQEIQAIIKPPVSTLPFWRLHDLLAADIPEREAFATFDTGTPVLTAASINQVCAPRGAGKTLFQLGWAVALSSGTDFICYKTARPLRVLYIEGELPDAVMKERLAALASGKSIPPENLTVITLDPTLAAGQAPIDLATVEGRQRVEAAIAEHKPDVLFLDSLSSLFQAGMNDEENLLTLNPWVMKLRSRGLCVNITQHAGKDASRGARGHSRSEDPLDVAIQLAPIGDPSESEHFYCKLSYTKFRAQGKGKRELLVKNTGNSDGFTYTGVQQDQLQQLRELISEDPKAPPRKIAKQLGISERSLYRLKQKLGPVKGEQPDIPGVNMKKPAGTVDLNNQFEKVAR